MLCCLLSHSNDIDAFRICKPAKPPMRTEDIAQMMDTYFSALASQEHK